MGFTSVYSPQLPGSPNYKRESGYVDAWGNQINTRAMVDTGQASYVTLAGNPAFYGSVVQFAAPSSDGSIKNYIGKVTDTGNAFANAAFGRFDIPIDHNLTNEQQARDPASGSNIDYTLLGYASPKNAGDIGGIDVASSGNSANDFIAQQWGQFPNVDGFQMQALGSGSNVNDSGNYRVDPSSTTEIVPFDGSATTVTQNQSLSDRFATDFGSFGTSPNTQVAEAAPPPADNGYDTARSPVYTINPKSRDMVKATDAQTVQQAMSANVESAAIANAATAIATTDAKVWQAGFWNATSWLDQTFSFIGDKFQRGGLLILGFILLAFGLYIVVTRGVSVK